MTTPERSLIAIASFLEAARVPYMIIGGTANLVWGEARATLDVDATVWVREDDIPNVVTAILARFQSLVPNPVEFVKQTRVLPLEDAQHARIDVIFGMLPFEEEAIQRAVTVSIEGVGVRFCNAEDLILHKIISDRERDLADAAGIVRARLPLLDLAYLEPRIAAFARDLDRTEIQDRWESWKRAASGRAPRA
jgi:hypothetical protein